MYELYMDGVMFPITPSKINTNIKNQNKTIQLANNVEINILKEAGLTSVSFDVLIPEVKYPFARYVDGFHSANYYLKKLNELKNNKNPFQFIITRGISFNTNITVSLEDYKIKEDAKNGNDIIVTINLKQYKYYGTKSCTIKIPKEEKKIIIDEPIEERETIGSPEPKIKPIIHKVKFFDTLSKLAKKYYDDGNKYQEIYDEPANKDNFIIGYIMKTGVDMVIPVRK